MLVTRAAAPKLLVTRGLAPLGLAPAAVTIGNFDGVHRGHQAMLARVIAVARDRGLTASVLTFEPHPRELFTPAVAPTRLTSLREKLELLAAHGVDHVHVQRFSRAFAALAPEAFVERALVGQLAARWVLVGEDFRYGAKRAGDFASLAAAGRPARLRARGHADRHRRRHARLELGGPRCARARRPEACRRAARACLQHQRQSRARREARPGARLRDRERPAQAQPAAARRDLRRPGPWSGAGPGAGIGAAPRDGVASLGVRPTVHADGRPVLEVHLFDFDGDLYGAHLTSRVPGEDPRRGALRRPRHAEGADRARLRRGARAAHDPLTRFRFSWPTTSTR